MEIIFILCIFLQVLISVGGDELSKIKLDKDGHFVDSQGRTVLLHGINAVQIGEPWYPEELTNKEHLSQLREIGMTVVRLGVMWTGVMPVKNEVNDTYLQKIEEIIDACAAHGIYVILDMQQEDLSSIFGTYDGVPPWLVDEACDIPYCLRYPWPYKKVPRYHFDKTVLPACARSLYTNVSGTLEYWGTFWESVAKAYSNKSNVLGYELMNRPNTPDTKLSSSAVYENHLLPVYDYLMTRIRRVDLETLIFYQGTICSNTFKPIPRPPCSTDGDCDTTTTVISYQYECVPLRRNVATEDIKPEDTERCITSNALFKLPPPKSDGGQFLTQFGVCIPDNNSNSFNTVVCSAVMDYADKHFQSWTYWGELVKDTDGNFIDSQVQTFSRVYPMYTLGKMNKFSFNHTTGEFRYEFMTENELTTEFILLSELFIPIKVHYNRGIRVQLSPQSLTYNVVENTMYIVAWDTIAGDAYTVTIIIERL